MRASANVVRNKISLPKHIMYNGNQHRPSRHAQPKRNMSNKDAKLVHSTFRTSRQMGNIESLLLKLGKYVNGGADCNVDIYCLHETENEQSENRRELPFMFKI